MKFIKKTKFFLFFTLFLWSCGGNKIDTATEDLPINREETLNGQQEDEKISIITETYENKTEDGIASAKIEYLQIEGMNDKGLQSKINEMLKKVFNLENAIPQDIDSYFEGMPQEMKEYEKKGDFTAGVTDSNLISFSVYQSEFMGGAHPTDITKGYNINPKTGNFYDIDAFIIPTKMKEFDELLLEEIKIGKCADSFDIISEEDVCKFNPDIHSFNFTPEVMEVHLIECFPHAARECNKISISYEKLKTVSIRDSPIAKFME